MNFPNNLVLVTGASGWLGHGLLNALVNGIPEVESLSGLNKDLKIRAFIERGLKVDALKEKFPSGGVFLWRLKG